MYDLVTNATDNESNNYQTMKQRRDFFCIILNTKKQKLFLAGPKGPKSLKKMKKLIVFFKP